MPVHIAHLSDLHYGESFHRATWESVINAVHAFRPRVLVVSGDFVDDPREDHLRNAKAEVDALVAQQKAKLAGEKELVKLKTFVPGYKRPLALSVVLFLLALVSFVAHRQTVTAKVTPRVKAAEGNQKLDAVAVSED